MKQGTGLPVFPGVALGQAVVYRRNELVSPLPARNPQQEQEKFQQALVTAKEQLSSLFETAKVELGEEQAAIVEVQLLMLEDLDYLEAVEGAISDGSSAAQAAREAGIWAGICGELGADSSMTEAFLRMGFAELSMAPGKILEIRKIVCESEE